MEPDLRYEEACGLMEAGKYQDALAILRDLAAVPGASSDVEYSKGLCLAALGRTTEARAAVRHLKDGGHVAMAQRLAERISQEDPFRLEPSVARPAAPIPLRRIGSPDRIRRYRSALLVAVSVLLVMVGVVVGMRLQPHDAAPPTAKDVVPSPKSVATPTPVSAAPASSDLTGSWQSVDFVKQVEDFRPEARSWKGELSVKDLQCNKDGTMSIGWTTWREGWIVHSNGRTRAQYSVKQIDGVPYLFMPWLSVDVTDRGQQPRYYVLRKASAQSQRPQAPSRQGEDARAEQRSFQTVRPVSSVAAFDDVRWKDLQQIEPAALSSLVATLTFNRATVWPSASPMPSESDPGKLMERAMNPGLGIRQLHRKGITGKGVNVAIIDQPLFRDHPEFAGTIVAYEDVGCGSEGSMHGPAVASLLVGKNCGTAPGAKLYYVAAPSWKKDAAYYANALDWIIEQNTGLPVGEKIRVVSVSAAPSGQRSPFENNGNQWDEACARAEAEGILVLDCTSHRGLIGPCYYDPSDPEDPAKCTPGFPGRPGVPSQALLVPCSPRTTAEQYNPGEFSYQYCGRGGLSWGIPYAAGVLALGWQLRPGLTSAQMHDLLFQSAYRQEDGAQIINPAAFVEAVKSATSASANLHGNHGWATGVERLRWHIVGLCVQRTQSLRRLVIRCAVSIL